VQTPRFSNQPSLCTRQKKEKKKKREKDCERGPRFLCAARRLPRTSLPYLPRRRTLTRCQFNSHSRRDRSEKDRAIEGGVAEGVPMSGRKAKSWTLLGERSSLRLFAHIFQHNHPVANTRMDRYQFRSTVSPSLEASAFSACGLITVSHAG
jgi:hypothetical protein